jgi:hypothetical protein
VPLGPNATAIAGRPQTVAFVCQRYDGERDEPSRTKTSTSGRPHSGHALAVTAPVKS